MTWISFERKGTTTFLLLTACLWMGCATPSEPQVPVALPPPLTLPQIKEMTERGVSDETIITTIAASRAIYQLSAAHVKELQEANVSNRVIDYLLSTPTLYPRERIIYRNYYSPWPYFYSGPIWYHHHHFYGHHHHRHH